MLVCVLYTRVSFTRRNAATQCCGMRDVHFQYVSRFAVELQQFVADAQVGRDGRFVEAAGGQSDRTDEDVRASAARPGEGEFAAKSSKRSACRQ